MLQDQENSHKVMKDNTAVTAKQEWGLESTTTHRMFKTLIYNNILDLNWGIVLQNVKVCLNQSFKRPEVVGVAGPI